MNGTFKTCTYRKQFYLLCCALFTAFLSTAQNPIVTENELPGNPKSEWDITGAGDLSIQGFATDISVNKGETIRFKISTDATAYTINIYRLGYYNGAGARFQGAAVVTATLPQTQPSPHQNLALGLVDCGNWEESAHWDVPGTAVSGLYIAKLTRTDNSGSSHIPFIVRDDAGNSDLLFQTSDATWQAYNVYGGNSLYVGATSYTNGHAVKVSYNRPFLTRAGGGGGGAAEDWIFNAEYPMIRFLERNGYNVSYTTNIDAERRGNLIQNHKVFLSVGHDEYWSAGQRNAVEAARAAGVHLAFFSGNEVYWKTRYEKNIDASGNEDPLGTDYRTLVCYKEGTLGENVCGGKCDNTSSVWTGLWRSGEAYDAGLPENALTSQIGWDLSTTGIKVPGHFKNLRFWRNTSIASIGSEDEVTLPFGTLGYEWDFEQYASTNPPGRILLSTTNFNGKTHKLSMYRHSNGALVFGAGTIQWSWGLDDQHDRGNLPASVDMQQATVNLFADMDVQPATLQGNLVAASISNDFSAPQTVITSLTNGSTVGSGSQVTITGTSTDVGGGTVAGVEVSVDGGATWKIANGSNSWTFNWIPGVAGTAVIRVRAFDDSGNMEALGTVPSDDAISVTIEAPVCPCTIFETTTSPALTNVYDGVAGIELGMKFRSNLDGYITGMRFFKSTNDVGTHTATIWSLDGNILTQGIFVNETQSGWQQVLFASPVAITAGTTYVASYHNPSGYYAETYPYFANNPVSRGPLTAIANEDAAGPNGVYAYSTSSIFPTSTFSSANYFVDVVFNTVIEPDVTPPSIVSTFPAADAVQVNTGITVKANFNEFIDGNTVNTSTFLLTGPGNVPVNGTVTLTPAQVVMTLAPGVSLAYGTPYTATLVGGASGIKDIHGNALANDYSWTFTTGDPPPLTPTEGYGGPILVISSTANKFSRFPVEILRAEGLNQFAARDISVVDATELNNYDVAVLGEMSISPAQATMFSDWVTAGGTLITLRPDADLAGLLGITPAAGTLSDQYLLVNTATNVGTGIVGQTIQFHGPADLYNLNGATAIATLYSNATTATTHPAVTSIEVGPNGGKAIAFTYDLAKSIVYTRQGNPAWAGQKRDGTTGPIRSDDMFYNAGVPSWIDMNKVAIPQADEQQRLLTNIIIKGNLHRKPLPRFWFLPRQLKAAVVMTGDDHANNGTLGRFNQYLTQGPNTAQDVLDWKSVRGTSYIFTYTPISTTQAAIFEQQGFEIALHVNTGCDNFTPAEYEDFLVDQLAELANAFPDISAPVTNRNHCIAWSDWASVAKIQAQYGIRLDANYYYWPAGFVQNRPGMFTGSGMPMRFADTDGTLIDCYQVATQLTDESGIDYNGFSAALFDKAIGPEGYYGVFNANMHTDTANHNGSNLIIANAQARNIPVISAKQMLTWLDGRNDSYFSNMSWTGGNQLNFDMTVRAGAYDLRAMLPIYTEDGQLASITADGNPVSFVTEKIKGIDYAFFPASNAAFVASYDPLVTGTINGSVTLQGRPPAPNARWEVPLQVDLYATGNMVTPAFTYNVTTDASGNFSIPNVPTGTYSIAVKNPKTLRRVRANEVISLGINTINFGILLAGDVNNNNFITLADGSVLFNSFNKGVGNPGYDARADLNGDNLVTLADASLLISNFNQGGQTP